MENLSAVLKIFIEKHLIPTIISIAGAITTLLFISEDNSVIHKIGKVLFIILAFCLYFLLVQFFMQVVNIVKKIFSSISYSNYRIKEKNKKTQEAIESINEFVDKLSPEDKKTLVTFVKNRNKILITYNRMGMYNNYDLLSNLNIVNVSDYVGDLTTIDREHYWIKSELEECIKLNMTHIGGLKQYKLKDDIFHDFKYVYDLTGKLGNF